MRAAAATIAAARARSPEMVSGTGGRFVMGLSPVYVGWGIKARPGVRRTGPGRLVCAVGRRWSAGAAPRSHAVGLRELSVGAVAVPAVRPLVRVTVAVAQRRLTAMSWASSRCRRMTRSEPSGM